METAKMLLKTVLTLQLLLVLIASSLTQTDESFNVCDEIAYSNICVQLNDKFYLIEGNAKLNWHDAERFCRRQNAFLVTIKTATEMKFISDYLLKENLSNDQRFWTGINDLGSPGMFYSIETGSLMPFSKWSTGQPDNAGGSENCIHIWIDNEAFAMNDVGCEHKMHYICELRENRNIHIYPKWRRSI